MKAQLIALCCGLVVALPACTGGNDSAPVVEVSGPLTDSGAPAPESPADQGLIEVLVATKDQQALALASGQAVSGELPVPLAGRLGAVAVFIGNYAGASDGELRVRICQADKCSEGIAPLVRSRDNAYLEAPLGTALDVTPGTATYQVSKAGGAHVVALWTYSPSGEEQLMIAADGASLVRTPRIALRYQR